MNPLLALLQLHTPTWIKKGQLQELFECTASAFDTEAPAAAGLSFDERLQRYARFTASQVEAAIRRGNDPDALRERLYRNGYRLGSKLRKRLRLSNAEEVAEAIPILYRALRIELRGPAGGEIEVAHCFFSRFYSGQVCQIVSALDAGVVAGLSNGGRLTFRQRITGGRESCRASFEEVTG